MDETIDRGTKPSGFTSAGHRYDVSPSLYWGERCGDGRLPVYRIVDETPSLGWDAVFVRLAQYASRLEGFHLTDAGAAYDTSLDDAEVRQKIDGIVDEIRKMLGQERQLCVIAI